MTSSDEPRVESRVLRVLVTVLLAGTALGGPAAALAQDVVAGDSAAPKEDRPSFLEGFRLYGSLRGQIAFYLRTVELQGNGSRVGFRLTRDFFNSGLRPFG